MGFEVGMWTTGTSSFHIRANCGTAIKRNKFPPPVSCTLEDLPSVYSARVMWNLNFCLLKIRM
jgi:hypothetical protein